MVWRHTDRHSVVETRPVPEQQASEAAPDWAQRRLAGPGVMAEPQEVPAVRDWAPQPLAVP
jgi:hypothetical protein